MSEANEKVWNHEPCLRSGFRFSCYCKKGSIINAIPQKALATLVDGWPGNLVNGRERCLRSWEDVKNFRWRAKAGNGEKRPWAADSSLLPNPGGLQKAGEKNQAESEVKWNRGVMLSLISKLDGGLRSVSGPSLEAKQKLLPMIHLLLWSSSEAATPTAVWCGPWTLGFQH